MKTPIVMALGLITLAGCATQGTAPQPSPDHPASPAAAEAALPEQSKTLAIVSPVRAEPLPPSGHNHVGPGTDDPVLGGKEHAGHGPAASSSEGVPLGTVSPAQGGAAASPPAAGGQLSVCPMHLKVVSADPSDRCPECKMKINKPVRKGAPSGAATTDTPATKPATDAHEHHGSHGGRHQ